ncbi:hypothetical protein NM09_18575 [Vibrio caribbeanicus]|uniref:Uncharacterized protein n=1 Tax=Vibrio caribbeanicus TaxID=701175 RepID=A0ACC4NSL1_9VIBR|nr:glycosyltransferase family 4 protein [Vibrio caribbeanicus]KHD23474.1 hypothetical protein NM09_18575 [Vibrio caribbeanicus]
MGMTSRILFVVNDLSMPGGLATVTSQLSQDLQCDDVNVECLTLANKYKHTFPSYVSELGLPYLHGLSPLGKVVWYINARRKLKNFLVNNHFDRVIGVGSAMSMLLTSLCSEDYQAWGAEHTAYANASRVRMLLKLICYKRLDRLVCLTESDAVRYRKSLRHVISIPNYTPYSTTEHICNVKAKRLLYLGRFTKTKGSDYLVQIVQRFAQQHPDWQISLFGEGPEKPSVEAGLSDFITKGQIRIEEPTSDVQSEYLQSSLLIMTSRNEGFPMVLLEAQAHGLPIVSFDCETGPSEIISDSEDGYLIPTFDVDAFAQQLVKLACDEDKRRKMSAKAVLHRQRFGKEAVISLWLEQFRK